MPCYNPPTGWAKNIIESLQRIKQLLPQVEVHLILVNDGSSTVIHNSDIALLQGAIPHFQYIPYTPNRGKGFALRKGVSMSTHEYCIYTDIDFPYQEKSLVELFHLLEEEQCDIAIGIKNEAYYKHVPPMRIRISKFLRWLIRTFLRISITDTQCGLKGFNAKGREQFLQTTIDRYLFDLEFVYRTDRNKDLEMKAMQVELKPGVIFSKVNWHILWEEGKNFLSILWKG